jgi:hypothetical protein
VSQRTFTVVSQWGRSGDALSTTERRYFSKYKNISGVKISVSTKCIA